MGTEIDEKSEKGEKKGMQKMMLEFDEKNMYMYRHLCPFRGHSGGVGGEDTGK